MISNRNNEQQFKEILESNDKKICVIAGPGSGKTSRVLIPKAKKIISSPEVDEKEILLLTFSRLSALDLKKKVKETLSREPVASTLHSLCLAFLLSENNHDIRKRVNSILLEFEKNILISDLKIKFPNKNKRDLEKMLKKFSAGWAIYPHDKVFNEDEEKRAFKFEVQNWLNEYEAAMMEEIVYSAVDLVKNLKSQGIISEFIDKPKYILVDEFQDLNELEQEFIEILGENSNLLLVVGDPNQSIYSFKFAHPNGIIDFAARDDVFDKTLPFSGRCNKNIINIANQLLKQANTYCKYLIEPMDDVEEGKVQLIIANTQHEEFETILNLIAKKLNSGVEAKNIFILVPRKKLGVEFAKYANKEKQNKNINNALSFLFSVKSGFNVTEEEKILELSLIANSNSLLHLRSYLGLGDSNHFSKEILQLKIKYGCLKDAFEKVNIEDLSCRNKRLQHVCRKITILKELLNSYQKEESLDNNLSRLLPEDDVNISELRSILLELKEESDTIQDLYNKFIDYSRTIHYEDNVVRIITLMSSKGLEADHVYIIGCNEGNIPGKNRSDYLTESNYKDEQRRLLYVGITRAKKTLTISWSHFIPFDQAKNQYTGSNNTITINGKKYSQMSISEFLQDLF